MPKFRVGQLVEWTSSNKCKAGRVVAVVPPNHMAKSHLPSGNWYRFMSESASPRDQESYIVAADRVAGSRAMKKLYWPRVSALRPI